jgi:hypothetical protein
MSTKLDMETAVVGPAFGDYKSGKEAEKAFLGGRDFKLYSPFHDGVTCSIRNFKPGTFIEIRYRSLEKSVGIKVPKVG